jgi:hypothetical protein
VIHWLVPFSVLNLEIQALFVMMQMRHFRLLSQSVRSPHYVIATSAARSAASH